MQNRRSNRTGPAASLLVLLFSWACAGTGPADPQPAEGPAEVSESREAPPSEIPEGAEVPEWLGYRVWEGIYHSNSIARDTLSIETGVQGLASAFTYLPHPDAGLGENAAFEGRLKDEQLSLHLICPQLDALGWPAGLGPYMVPVTWGERRYLIPKGQMVEFCNSINAGFEVSAVPLSPFLLREGGEGLAVEGVPALPEFYVDYVLPAPIEAVVLDVRRWEEASEPLEAGARQWILTLNAGGGRGVKAGMEFHFTDTGLGHVEGLRVLRVAPQYCEVLVDRPAWGAEVPRIGWQVSTRSPYGGLEEPWTPR